MLSSDLFNRYLEVRDKLLKLDEKKVSRSELGTLAIQETVQALRTAASRIPVFEQVLDQLDPESASLFIRDLELLHNTLQQSALMPPGAVVSQRSDVLEQLRLRDEEFRGIWPYIVSVSLEHSGVLQSQRFTEKLKKDAEELTDEMSRSASQAEDRIQNMMRRLKDDSESQLSGAADRFESQFSRSIEDHEKRLSEASDRILAMAKAEADRIEARARETSKEVSVKAAQDQFDRAQPVYRWKAGIWSALTVLAFSLFFVYANELYQQSSKIPVTEPIQILIYRFVLRITVLTGIGACANFFLKMTRAHFHLLEQNSHRRRVANSMVAFVDAAMTREQRDLILGKLVESVVDFGDSGILDKDKEPITGPSVAIEAISKTFSSK